MRLLYILALFLSFSASLNGFSDWNLATRLSLGPSWHRFNLVQLFDINPIDLPRFEFLPSEDIAQTPYLIMPYLEGMVRLFPYKNFNMNLSAGGGALKNGIGTMNIPFPGLVNAYTELFHSILPTQLHSSIALVDAGLGYTLYNSTDSISFNPLIGYAFNVQKPTFYLYSVDTTFAYINIWKGPYLGFEFTCNLHKYFDLELLYKFSIAKLSSRIDVKSPPNLIKETIILSDATHSTAHGKAWGNTAQVIGWYSRNFWKLGVGLKYLQYNNHKNIPVCLGSTNTFGNPENTGNIILGSRINHILWQQLFLTMSLEAHF